MTRDLEALITPLCIMFILTVFVSDTVAGLILRATMTVWFYWLGIIDYQPAENFILNFHW